MAPVDIREPVVAREPRTNAVGDPGTRAIDVSIVIPSRNRSAQLRQAIERCLALDPPPREIVVVDDHSDDDTGATLEAFEKGTVKYIRLPTNEGQALARSVGFATAKGRYLVSLDDDSWFLEKDALQRIWNRFERMPACGILALHGFSPGIPLEPARERLSTVADHITCGAAYRSAVLRQTGYHLAFLRYEGEEADLSLKVIGAGYDIVFDESIRFFHDYDPSKRSRQSLARVRRMAVQNDLLRAWIYFPLGLAFTLTCWRSLSHLRWGVRTGMIGVTLLGYLEFVRGWPRALVNRQPIGRDAALKYLRLRRRPQVIPSE